MKRFWLLLGLATAACSSVGDVMPIGVDKYTVSSHMDDPTSSWPEVKALSINRANEFCGSKNKRMSVVSWEMSGEITHDAELIFECVP